MRSFAIRNLVRRELSLELLQRGAANLHELLLVAGRARHSNDSVGGVDADFVARILREAVDQSLDHGLRRRRRLANGCCAEES